MPLDPHRPYGPLLLRSLASAITFLGGGAAR